MTGTGDRTEVGARRFEAYVRWSTYAIVTAPIITVVGVVTGTDRLGDAHIAAEQGWI